MSHLMHTVVQIGLLSSPHADTQIHVEDLVRLAFFALSPPAETAAAVPTAEQLQQLRGPLNAVAPTLTRNREFVTALARAMRRPMPFAALLPPTPMLRLVFGSYLVDTVLLAGQRAIPQKALRLGFQFRYPDIASACAEICR